MNGFKTALLTITATILTAGVVLAVQHGASPDRGKALFNDPKLGTTGKTCNDCHLNGKGIERAAGRKNLGPLVNACITGPLQGEALDPDSDEMQSLLLYVNSLGKTKKKKAKKAPVGC